MSEQSDCKEKKKEEEKQSKDAERRLLREAVVANESIFENKLTYISGGALAISLTFIEKIVSIDVAKYLWILVLSWVLLSLTLFVNLLSCPLAAKFGRKSERDIIEEKPDKYRKTKNRIRNKIITGINWVTLIGLCIGVTAMVVFSSINIITKI